MKKRLLPLALLVTLGLVACTPAPSSQPSTPSTPSSSEPSSEPAGVTTMTIKNKTALQAEWHVGDANRAIELETDQPININAEIADGNLVITSSDSAIVLVNGKYLSAVGVGTVTITATYKDTLTDTVEITTLDTLEEPAYKPATPASLLTQEDNVGTYAYFVDGKVKYWASATETNPDKYGNMYLEDLNDSSKAFYLYGTTADASALTYSLSNKAYSFSNPKTFLTNEYTGSIKIGDTLNTITIRKDYKTTVEGMSIIRGINGVIIPNYVQTTDEVFAAEFQDNYAVQVTGKITGFYNSEDGGKYGNVIIKSVDSEKELIVYGLTAQTDCLKIDSEDGGLYMQNPQDFLTNSATNKLAIGDEITVVGIRADYKGTPQIKGYLKPAAEPSISLDTSKVSLATGKTKQLEITLTNIDGDITWTSSDETIATVKDGLITAVKAGKATITAKVEDLETTCAVTVYDPIPEPTSHNTTKTLAEILAPEKVKYSTEIVELQVKISGYKAENDAWEQYGNMVVTDLDGNNEVNVYGSTASQDAIVWNEQYGNYSFKNPKDFVSNAKTAALKIGDVIDVWAIRSDYVKDDSVTKQLNLVIIFQEETPEVVLADAKQPAGITWGNWGDAESTQVITLDPNNKENEVLAHKQRAGFASMFVLMTNIQAGKTYNVSFDFYAPAGCDNVGIAFWCKTDNGRLPELNVLDAAQVEAAGATITDSALGTGWKHVAWNRTFTEGKVYDSAHLWANAAAGTVYLDNFTATIDGDETTELFIGGDFTGWLLKEAEGTTVTKTVEELAKANSWTHATLYESVALDEVITASVATSIDTGYPQNSGKYYTGKSYGHQWRLYETEGASLTLTAEAGYEIVSCKVTYVIDNAGAFTGAESDQVITVNAASYTYNIELSDDGNKGQVRITAIEVVYAAK